MIGKLFSKWFPRLPVSIRQASGRGAGKRRNFRPAVDFLEERLVLDTTFANSITFETRIVEDLGDGQTAHDRVAGWAFEVSYTLRDEVITGWEKVTGYDELMPRLEVRESQHHLTVATSANGTLTLQIDDPTPGHEPVVAWMRRVGDCTIINLEATCVLPAGWAVYSGSLNSPTPVWHVSSIGARWGGDVNVFRAVTVSGTLFHDYNGDGQRQPGEPGFANAETFSSALEHIRTDADGNFTLRLAPGTTALPRWTNLPGNLKPTNHTEPEYFGGGQIIDKVDLGYFEGFTLTGFSFVDNDGNRLQSPQENNPPIRLVAINKNGVETRGIFADSVSEFYGSAPRARYGFDKLPPGDYTLRLQDMTRLDANGNPVQIRAEEYLLSWADQPGKYGDELRVTVGTGLTFASFIVSPRLQIFGRRYEDVNHNGVFDHGTDKPLVNRQLKVDLHNDGTWDAVATSGVEGFYSFNAPAGTHHVRPVLAPGEIADVRDQIVTLTVPGTYTAVNVGSYMAGDIAMIAARLGSSNRSVAFDISSTKIAKPFTVALYQSASSTFDPATATELKRQTIGPKAAHGNFKLKTPVVLNANTNLFVVADPDSEIAESNEKNNVVKLGLNAWTIFVYMSASDLYDYAAQDIKEMEIAAAQLPESVKIVVLWDQTTGNSYRTGNGLQSAWGTSGRAIINGSTDKDIATTFEILPEQKTDNPATLRKFLEWGVSVAPAEHYAMMFWGHGGGIFGSSYDFQPGARKDLAATPHLTMPETVKALTAKGMPHFDLLAYDACLMGMVEVGYSVRNLTDVFVASEETARGSGHDYTQIFNVLQTNPQSISPAVLGSEFVTSWEEQYFQDSRSWDTYSMTAPARYDALAVDLNGFVGSVRTLLTNSSTGNAALRAALLKATEAATAYELQAADAGVEDSRDLGSFMEQVLADPALSSLHVAAREVLHGVRDVVISKSLDQRSSSGVAIYLPTENVTRAYVTDHAEFNKATGWDKFINWLANDRWSTPGRSGATTGTIDSGSDGSRGRAITSGPPPVGNSHTLPSALRFSDSPAPTAATRDALHQTLSGPATDKVFEKRLASTPVSSSTTVHTLDELWSSGLIDSDTYLLRTSN